MRAVRRPHVPRVPKVSVTVVLAGLLVALMGTGTTTAVTVLASRHAAPHHAVRVAPARSREADAAPLTRVSPATTPAPVTSAPAASGAEQAPASTTAAVVHVPRPKHLVAASLLVTSTHRLTARQTKALHRVAGVAKVETVDTGRASVDGHRADLVGVRPASFRAWTPKLTAKSNALWTSIASGELTASFDMGHDAKLPLGGTVPVRLTVAHQKAKAAGAAKAAKPAKASGAAASRRDRTLSAPAVRPATPVRIGAFASVGLSGVDAVVDHARARQIGLVSDSGAVISAPKADALVLRRDVVKVLGRHARVVVLNPVVVTRDAGEFITRAKIATYLAAAASRVGKPYVWGATGPGSFDCSGLVLWSFAHAGIHMPRVAAQQFLTGAHVSYADARPGDLLFWHYDPTDPTDIDHVAIYAGDGKMLVAPHTGLDVEYVPVPLAHFAGAVRVDPALLGQVG